MTRNKFEAAFGKAHPHLLYENLKVKYVIEHSYTPDWIDPLSGRIYETKGKWDSADRTKILAVIAQNPSLDITMVFYRPETPIRKGSKTTYASWCDKHGIKWIDGSKWAGVNSGNRKKKKPQRRKGRV